MNNTLYITSYNQDEECSLSRLIEAIPEDQNEWVLDFSGLAPNSQDNQIFLSVKDNLQIPSNLKKLTLLTFCNKEINIRNFLSQVVNKSDLSLDFKGSFTFEENTLYNGNGKIDEVTCDVTVVDDGLKSKDAFFQCFQKFPNLTNLTINFYKGGDTSKACWLSFDEMVAFNDGLKSSNINQITFVNTTTQYVMFSINNGAKSGGLECANGTCNFNFMGHFTFNLTPPSNTNITKVSIDQTQSKSGSNFDLNANAFPEATIEAKDTWLFLTAPNTTIQLGSLAMGGNSRIILFPTSNLEIFNGNISCSFLEIQGDPETQARIHSQNPLVIDGGSGGPIFYIDQLTSTNENLISSDVQLTINGPYSFQPESFNKMISPSLTNTTLSIAIQ